MLLGEEVSRNVFPRVFYGRGVWVAGAAQFITEMVRCLGHPPQNCGLVIYLSMSVLWVVSCV